MWPLNQGVTWGYKEIVVPNIFQGQLIRLRAMEPTDWEEFHKHDRESTDPGYFTDEVWFPASTRVSQDWAEREAKHGPVKDEFRFAIERLDGALVGTLNTHTTNPRCGTFRYGLGLFPEHQRKGYASDAIRLVLRYFFQERRYQKCNVEVYAFNTVSIRLHEALGFTLEGRLRRMIYTGGEFHDALIYGMTREEFDSKWPQAP